MAQRRNGLMVSTRLTKDEYLRLNELADAQGSNVYKLLRDMIAERLEESRAA